jgi:hypothetical protein
MTALHFCVMAKSKASRPKSTRSSKTWSTPRLGGPNVHTFFLIFVPATIAVLLLTTGASTLAVFIFAVGGVRYHIGAQGYATSGNDRLSVRPVPLPAFADEIRNGPSFNYPVPSSWPSPVDKVPLILLLHLILGVFLVIFLLLMFVVFVATKYSRIEAITKPKVWNLLLRALMALLVFVLVIVDIVFWAQAQAKKLDLHPDVLGYL